MNFKKVFFLKKSAVLLIVVIAFSFVLTGCQLQEAFSNLNNGVSTGSVVNLYGYYNNQVDLLGQAGFVRFEGTANTTGQASMQAQTGMVTIEAVANEGFTFAGWYMHNPQTLFIEANKVSVLIETYLQEGTRVLLLFAHFTQIVTPENTHTITFMQEGSMYEQTEVADGSVLTLPTAPQKTGHTFWGWNTVSDGSGEFYNANTVITNEQTLYAIFQINTYSVTYNANGGMLNAPSTYSVQYGSMLGANMPTNPTRQNYTFLGWNASMNGTGAVYNQNSIITNAVVLYAIWQPTMHTITYNANGGSLNGQTNFNIAHNTPLGSNMPQVNPRQGYTFAGWNTSNSGSGTMYQANTVVTSSTTLYAVWTLNSYTVTYNANGGNISGKTTYIVFHNNILGSNMPFGANKEGYTFMGWSTSSTGTVATHNSNTTVTSNLTLYAVWKEAVFTVTFYPNGGTLNSKMQFEVEPGTLLEEIWPEEDPTRLSYNFMGWATTPNATAANVSPSTPVNNNMNLYAVWRSY